MLLKTRIFYILCTYSVACQVLVVFQADFLKIFKILISGCWCFKSAQKWYGIRTMGVASKPVKPHPQYFAGFIIYVKTTGTSNFDKR